MIEYYKKRAQEYELIYQKKERQKDLIFIADYLSNIFEKKEVLDVGCGTGYWSEKIARTSHSIFGIDINQEVLDIAGSKEYHSTPHRFQVLDYHELHSIPQLFSGLFCGFVWSHIYKKELPLFVKSLLQKLNENGTLIIIDNKYVEGNNTAISRKDDMGNTYQNRKLSNGETFEVLKNFPSKKELETLFQNNVSNYKWIELEYFWIWECKV